VLTLRTSDLRKRMVCICKHIRWSDVCYDSRAMVRLPLTLTVLAFCVSASDAPPKRLPLRQPVIRSVFPLGGQVGQRVVLDLRGDFLDRATAVRCECSDLRPVVRSASALTVSAGIDIPASAEPGARTLWVETPRGGSNRFVFRVTRWVSTVEQEPNDMPDGAQRVNFPSVVEGRVARLTDVDFFRFHAAAGERLAFNVMAARSKAPGFVTINLLSSDGRELARNNSRIGPDPYLDHTFVQEGDYFIVVTPRRFADFFTVVKDDQLINWQYQLSIGRSPMLWSVFPMGGRRGSHVEAEMRANFVPSGAQPRVSGSGVSVKMSPVPDDCECRYRLNIDIDREAAPGVRHITVPDDSGNGMALGFEVGETPELLEADAKPQNVELPAIINGRIAAPNQQDAYRFKVNQDDEVTFVLNARSFGSQVTDPQLALLRSQGDLVRFGDDRCQPCTPVDTVDRKKEMLDPRFTHKFVSSSANDADAAGEYDIFVLDNSSRGGETMPYRLTLRHKQPQFAVGVLSDHVNAAGAMPAKIPVAVAREEGFRDGVEVVADALPDGWTTRPLTLGAGQETGDLEIVRGPGAPRTGTVEIRAKAKIGDREMVRAALVPPVLTEDGAGFLEPDRSGIVVQFVDEPVAGLKLEEPNGGFVIDLKKTTKVDVPITVERSSEFTGSLAFQIEELPEGVALQAQRVDGDRAVLTLEAEPGKVKPGAYRIAARATGQFQGRDVVEVTSGVRLGIR
jgi:hypothetical protein